MSTQDLSRPLLAARLIITDKPQHNPAGGWLQFVGEERDGISKKLKELVGAMVDFYRYLVKETRL